MILHDNILNDGLYPHKNMYDKATELLHNLHLRLLNNISIENFEKSCNSRKMVYFYSKRFPNMCMSSSFYEDMMKITEMHVNSYRSRWFDFGQVCSEPSFKDSPVPWSTNSVAQPILTPITFGQSANYRYNINEYDLSKCYTPKVKSPKKLGTILVPTTNPVELCLSSTSSKHFEEPVTPIRIISKSNKDFEKSPEVNNNIIEDDDIKSGSISSGSSRSNGINDEKTVSYAEIIKHSKPKKNSIIKINVEELKKGELNKSNRIPPSKKISIKLPDGPFLPNYQHCAFCKNNGEDETVYRTHFVKDEWGNVKCPLLSRYTCPHCKATGSKAHTISRCPSSKQRILKSNK